ncbi:Multi antimicrobial extrusion protein [Corchorus olitorius]|uniref:Multi antimicrobial extrusion protein n=1 Tax=Corchorus olitorius TaxID=93759 RepID=A0A1R3JT85_9ROSI|nr:Multi antimicrobial extrusion protein [Corchorus olitorius]
MGANQPKKAKLAAFVGLFCGFMLGFSALMFAFTVRNMWATMFTDDKEIIALTSMVLPIIGLCELGNCPQTTGCGVLRGTARPKVGANINLGCFYLVGTPVAIWLAFYAGFDFKGLWLGLLAAQGSCMVTMMVVLVRTDWELEAERAKQLTGAVMVVVDDSNEVEQEKLLKPEIKEDSFSLLGDLEKPDHYSIV